jgi:hypothetical protein
MKHSLSALLCEKIILNTNRTRRSQTAPTVGLDVVKKGKKASISPKNGTPAALLEASRIRCLEKVKEEAFSVIQ